MSLTFGQRVVFDHYRPWPDQIPPLQRWLYQLFSHARLLVNICHSNYTREAYLRLGIDEAKLRRVLNGFEPQRLDAPVSTAEAKSSLGLDPARKTIVYTGRVNHKKGLALVVEAAKALPELLFLLVGSKGEGPIEALAQGVPNIRMVPFQPPEALVHYIYAADVLLIPPSLEPLAQFGSTVLPLKLFFYLGAGKTDLGRGHARCPGSPAARRKRLAVPAGQGRGLGRRTHPPDRGRGSCRPPRHRRTGRKPRADLGRPSRTDLCHPDRPAAGAA